MLHRLGLLLLLWLRLERRDDGGGGRGGVLHAVGGGRARGHVVEVFRQRPFPSLRGSGGHGAAQLGGSLDPPGRALLGPAHTHHLDFVHAPDNAGHLVSHHQVLVDLEGVAEHVLAHGLALQLPQRRGLLLQVVLVVAHGADGQTVPGVAVHHLDALPAAAPADQVGPHPDQLVQEPGPGDVEGVPQRVGLDALLLGEAEHVAGEVRDLVPQPRAGQRGGERGALVHLDTVRPELALVRRQADDAVILDLGRVLQSFEVI